MNRYETLSLSPGAVSLVTLNRPEIKNAFNEIMIRELAEVFAQLEQDPVVRVVVLRGAGSLFCAGGDLNWMRRSKDLTLAENQKDTLTLTRMFDQLNRFSKPLIGAIHGAAIGGGVGLVSVCDIVYAVESTQFSLSEVRLGIVPACIGPYVVSKIGASHARALFMSAERFLAKKAQAVGLVHEVFATQEQMDEALTALTQNLLQCSPQAVGVAKQLVLDLTWHDRRKAIPSAVDHVSDVLARLRVTPEAQEGLSAFLEKRKPAWISDTKSTGKPS